MTSADYFAQAEHVRGRAARCRRLADDLERATLFDLHRYSGEDTWQGPVAIEFADRLAGYCAQLSAAIDRLRSNVIALSCAADDLERHGAILLAAEVA
jgi:hypothetical protein